MATISRTGEMFGLSVVSGPRVGAFQRICRALSQLMLAPWVVAYAEDMAAEARSRER